MGQWVSIVDSDAPTDSGAAYDSLSHSVSFMIGEETVMIRKIYVEGLLDRWLPKS